MNNNIIILLTFLCGMFFISCGGNEKGTTGTTSNTIETDTLYNDSTSKSDTSVKPANSTSTFRNGRGTDSVSVGSTVPVKP